MKPLVLTGRWTPEFMEHDLADLVLDLALFDFVLVKPSRKQPG